MPSVRNAERHSFQVTQSLGNYPLRLPSYRSSYLERFHPYGSRKRKVKSANRNYTLPANILVETTEEDGGSDLRRFSCTLSVITEEGDELPAISILLPAMERAVMRRRSRLGLVDSVVDFVFTVRRHLSGHLTIRSDAD